MSKFLKCPVEHVQVAMDAAAPTADVGLILNYNIGAVPAIVKVTGYVKTAPTAGTTFDVGHHATSKTKNATIVDGVTNIAGTIFGPGCTLTTVAAFCAANEYITAYNLATNTNTAATLLDGYFDLEIIRFPVRVGDQ
jgi:hypothetical protein